MNYSNKQKRQLVKEDYNAIAEIYVKNCSEVEFYRPYIDDFIKNLKGKKVLDAGCGHGIFTNYFYQKGLDVQGIDFSEKLLNVAKQNYQFLKFTNVDMCNFETKERFDGIFIKNVLFHIPDEDIKQIFKKFKKFLNANGKICILMEIPKEAGEQILAEEFDENLKVYYNYMMPEKVEQLLVEAGFEIDKLDIVKKNQNATVYAFGLMAIQATIKEEK